MVTRGPAHGVKPRALNLCTRQEHVRGHSRARGPCPQHIDAEPSFRAALLGPVGSAVPGKTGMGRTTSSTPGAGPLPRYTADTYCVILCSQNCFVTSNSLLSISSGVISCRLRGCASQSESHQATVYGHVFMLVRKCIFYIETAFLKNVSRILKILCLISLKTLKRGLTVFTVIL